MIKKTIYVGFDGTLCVDKGLYPGAPIKPMVDRVKRWIREGHTVKIFTARLDEKSPFMERCQVGIITDWCEREGLVNLDGSALVITNRKGRDCDEIWDDRAVSVNEYGNYTSMRKTAAAVDYQKHMPVNSQIYDTLLKNGHLHEAAEAAEQQMWSAQAQQALQAQQQYAATQYATSLQNWALQQSGRPLTGSQASTLAWLAATNEVDPPQDNPEGTTLISRRLEDGTYEYFPEPHTR